MTAPPSLLLLSITLSDVLRNVPFCLVALASIIGLVRFRQLPMSLRYLTALTCFYVVLEGAASLLMTLQIPNLFIIPIAAAGEFWLLALVYGYALQSPTFNRLAPWAVGLLTIYVVLDSVLAPETARFKPSLQVVSDLVSLGLACLYFGKLLNELKVTRLERDPMFWASTSLAIFALGDLLIALFSNYILAHYSHQLNALVWQIHTFLTGLVYGGYCLALWMRPQK